jgi:hypothetical protein
MPFMRFYRINPNGHITAPAEEFECTDDAEAMAKATALLVDMPPNGAVEVWERARFVGKVPAAAHCATQPNCAECAPGGGIAA